VLSRENDALPAYAQALVELLCAHFARHEAPGAQRNTKRFAK